MTKRRIGRHREQLDAVVWDLKTDAHFRKEFWILLEMAQDLAERADEAQAELDALRKSGAKFLSQFSGGLAEREK